MMDASLNIKGGIHFVLRKRRCCPRTKMRAEGALSARFCIFLLTNPHFLRMIEATLKIVSNWL